MDLRDAPPALWVLLGEGKSKCQHVGRSLLSPTYAAELMQVYVARGVLATTAIEGNTLTEEEVRKVFDGSLHLPPSRQYLQREVENVLAAYNQARDELKHKPDLPFSVERLCAQNRQILDGLEVEEGVVPGELRRGSVVVGPYRAAPPGDCEYLLERLCDWLNGPELDAPEDQTELRAPFAILKAIVAHLYLAWIHPFGDGNGRTARLLELQILLSAGFPAPTCQLLSNHYNLTRTEYYRQLDAASRGVGVARFLTYATRGFVDQLSAQLALIWLQQFTDRWDQFVYQRFGERRSATDNRRLWLVLDISRRSRETNEPVLRREVVELTPRLARAYATKTQKTLTRDLNAISELGLLRQEGAGWMPADDQIHLLHPPRPGGILWEE